MYCARYKNAKNIIENLFFISRLIHATGEEIFNSINAPAVFGKVIALLEKDRKKSHYRFLETKRQGENICY